jgi:hypothetical protein
LRNVPADLSSICILSEMERVEWGRLNKPSHSVVVSVSLNLCGLPDFYMSGCPNSSQRREVLSIEENQRESTAAVPSLRFQKAPWIFRLLCLES